MSTPSLPNSGANGDNVYPNAFFDYMTKLMPKQLKVLFTWLEYLYVNSGHIFGALKKYTEYPITEIELDTEGNEALKRNATELLEKHLKMKSVLVKIGLDYGVYGNSMFSLFKPFDRYLKCTACKSRINIKQAKYKWNRATCDFILTCGSCKTTKVAEVINEKVKDPARLRVIRWDIKNIDINFNPITGEREYYYNIPRTITDRLKGAKADAFLLETLPMEFIDTLKAKQIFKFAEGALFHMAAPSLSGINMEWGFPSLLSAMKPFFYTAILRKANEAIALEHIVPMRVMYPQGTSVNNDPTQYISMSRWRGEMEGAIKKWRKDPNHIKFSPIPVGVENMGGNGRAMLTIGEVQSAEENIVTSMGVPKEFVYGGLSDRSGGVTLRMLENMMLTYVAQLKEAMQWLTDEATDYLGWGHVETDMQDFKLIDDIGQKQTSLTMGAQAGIMSKTKMASLLNIDLEEERTRMHTEAIDDARWAVKTQASIRKIQESAAQKVLTQQSGDPLSYDANAVMQVAQQQATQLIQVPMEHRKSMLQQMQQQDPVLHAVVLQQLAQLHKMEREQGAGAAAQQAGISDPNAVKPSPTANV